MTSRRLSDRIRSNVWGLVACFIAITGTAVVAQADQGAPNATQSAGSSKQVKKLKRQIAGLGAELTALKTRLAALEGRPVPTSASIPTTLPPSGPAGGELAGTYPNPTVGTVSGLSVASSTSPGAGISFGTDVNLYRSSATGLRTDDFFTAGGLTSNGGLTVTGNANITGFVTAANDVDSFGEVSADENVVAGGYLETSASATAPPTNDCDSVTEAGQLRIETDTEQLWACTGTAGWIQFQGN